MAHKDKKPKRAIEPITKKQPKSVTAGSIPQSSPSWRMGRVDIDGPWCWKKMAMSDFDRVRIKLANFESMTWSAILGSENHEIAVDRLCKTAQDRLGTLKLDDIDVVLSLRVKGAERVIGYRQDGAVYLLWWDPRHEVCPSTLKHT